MGLFKSVTRPISNLSDAVFMPFKAVFVVGLCWVINAMTFSGTWWVQWVALGMGIATVVALARGLKALLVIGLVAWIGSKLYRRYGPEVRQRFDDWARQTQPAAAELVSVLRAPRAAANGGSGGTAPPARQHGA